MRSTQKLQQQSICESTLDYLLNKDLEAEPMTLGNVLENSKYVDDDKDQLIILKKRFEENETLIIHDLYD